MSLVQYKYFMSQSTLLSRPNLATSEAFSGSEASGVYHVATSRYLSCAGGSPPKSQSPRRPQAQTPDGSDRARPEPCPVGRAQGGLGWLCVLRCLGQGPATRLRTGHLPGRAVHPRQHRPGLRNLQREQVQRRSHRLAEAEAVQERAFLCGTARSVWGSRCNSRPNRVPNRMRPGRSPSDHGSGRSLPPISYGSMHSLVARAKGIQCHGQGEKPGAIRATSLCVV